MNSRNSGPGTPPCRLLEGPYEILLAPALPVERVPEHLEAVPRGLRRCRGGRSRSPPGVMYPGERSPSTAGGAPGTSPTGVRPSRTGAGPGGDAVPGAPRGRVPGREVRHGDRSLVTPAVPGTAARVVPAAVRVPGSPPAAPERAGTAGEDAGDAARRTTRTAPDGGIPAQRQEVPGAPDVRGGVRLGRYIPGGGRPPYSANAPGDYVPVPRGRGRCSPGRYRRHRRGVGTLSSSVGSPRYLLVLRGGVPDQLVGRGVHGGARRPYRRPRRIHPVLPAPVRSYRGGGRPYGMRARSSRGRVPVDVGVRVPRHCPGEARHAGVTPGAGGAARCARAPPDASPNFPMAFAAGSAPRRSPRTTAPGPMAVVMIMAAGAHRGPPPTPAVAAGRKAMSGRGLAGGRLGAGGSIAARPLGGSPGARSGPGRRLPGPGGGGDGTSESLLHDKISEKRPSGTFKNPNEPPGLGRRQGGAPSQKAPRRPAGGCPST